jgi:EAL domain-containing protein (putative c-di-GMP-specific phosphodiesterase class I)
MFLTLQAAKAADGSASVPQVRPVAEHVLVLAHDPTVIAAASAAVYRRHGQAPTIARSGPEALLRLAGPGLGPHHLVADPSAAGASWPHLLATLAEPSARTSLVVVSAQPASLPRELAALPAEPDRLADAMNGASPSQAEAPQSTAADLAAGLGRGEIVVRYQPVVRTSDRRPVMVEALARWHREAAAIPPDRFVPMAERAGLVRALSIVVASRIATELGQLHGRLGIGVSLNLPLALLLQQDLPRRLHRALGHSGLRPANVALELTETTEVHDISSLRRALLRLRAEGYRVLLDDLELDDERQRFIDLPFAGFKLDRSLVTALPDNARARRQALRLVQAARCQGQVVIAEGVSDLRLWATVRGLGIHHAQGFIVGRPLPAEALPAWCAGWRSRQPG